MCSLDGYHMKITIFLMLLLLRQHLRIINFILISRLSAYVFQMMAVCPITLIIYVSFEDILVLFSWQTIKVLYLSLSTCVLLGCH